MFPAAYEPGPRKRRGTGNAAGAGTVLRFVTRGSAGIPYGVATTIVTGSETSTVDAFVLNVADARTVAV